MYIYIYIYRERERERERERKSEIHVKIDRYNLHDEFFSNAADAPFAPFNTETTGGAFVCATDREKMEEV